MSTRSFFLHVFLLLASLPLILAQDVLLTTMVIDGTARVAATDEHFVCATLDWWPPDKCDYNQCPWGNASILNLDLSNPILAKAIHAFDRLRIRVGGSLQDQVHYDIGNLKVDCSPFRKQRDGLFGFSKGCLHMDRWNELNQLFSKTRAIVTFGLNALYGRRQVRKGVWGGAWDPSNTRDFIEYTISKGHEIDSWEFGNELSGDGVGASVNAVLYGKDVINLKRLINKLYKNSSSKPSLVAPGGFFDQQWYAKFLRVSGPGVVHAVTHHIYNLGAGVDPNLVKKILDPNHLSKVSETYSRLDETIQSNSPWASPWVGESGGAYNSGGRNVSNTFVNSFWYLDQLGMSSIYHTKVHCRQSLIGGNYGLLDTTTYVPNPDYYSALLWHRLMGKAVLSIQSDSLSPFLRAYVHCLKGREGITLLLLNLSNQTQFIVDVQNSINRNFRMQKLIRQEGSSFIRRLKSSIAWVGIDSGKSLTREEYHLSPKDGILQSQTMVLNGVALELTEDGDIPSLNPVHASVDSPIDVKPLSFSFIVFPNFEAPVCS